MKKIRVCLTGGATGGHFFPLIFVARELKKISQEKNFKIEIFYIGGEPFDKKLMEEEGIRVYVIPSFKLRRYFDIKNFFDFLKAPFSFLLSFFYMFLLMPDVLFSKGGPSSIAVVFSAWFFRIPILIHDSDSVPGLANRISAKFARKVALAFPSAQKYFSSKEVVIVGQPIDERIIYTPITQEDYERFHLNKDEKIILILGGSQGSQFLNEIIIEILPQLLKISQVVHLTGKKFFQEAYSYALGIIRRNSPLEEKKYKAFPFLNNEDNLILMKMSDLIISRAGSSSIFEIAALGKPSILIPLPEDVVGSHQKENAYYLQKIGACYVLEEANVKPHLLLNLIQSILKDEELKEKMGKNALNFYKPHAARKIAEEILVLAQFK